MTERQGSEHRTYKLKGKPIAKIIIKGKTVCICLAVSPLDLANTKYIFKNALSVKKHKTYPTIVKLTSNRQVKWSIELVNKIASGLIGGAL